MRPPAVTARQALHSRLIAPDQQSELQPSDALPPYMESFLAHIRLLVGVPFEYLVPDDRLLPPESIRFFYVDRSWTDRLVDGALAVGQIGSREAAHFQSRATTLTQQLDQSERMVRSLQRRVDFVDAKAVSDADRRPADVVTGFILRSSAVKNWPHMDVRAYATTIDEPYETADPNVVKHQLKTLRIELLAPSVMIALFETEPQMVILEEPHHGVQFGIRRIGQSIKLPLRDGMGSQIRVNNNSIPITVPMRSRHRDVVRVKALRNALQAARGAHPTAVDQTGSGGFAISVLDPPWRQHFEGTEDHAQTGDFGTVRPYVDVAVAVRSELLLSNVKTLVEGH
ncbi:MAG TPA: hypothetical protein VGA62_07445 [Acidimicrobiia bacterium]